MLSAYLAKKIIDEVKKLFDKDIIIVGVDGIIMASSDEQRVGKFHEGALISVQEKRKVIIKKEDEAILQGVKAGLNLPILFLDRVIGVIGITGDPDLILPYGELLKKMTELLVQENYYSEQKQWRFRMLESFVYDWIQQNHWSAEFIELAKILNINIELDRQLILIQSTGRSDFLLKGISELTYMWDDFPEDVLIPWGNDRLLLIHHYRKYDNRQIKERIKQLKSYILKNWTTDVSIGISQTVASKQISKGYEQAEQALNIALKTNDIVFEEDLRLELCLEEISQGTFEKFTKRILLDVINDDELLETFYTFFENNMSIKRTADALHIHINTLHYRMKKLESMTGLDLKKTKDIVNLYLALHFLYEHPKKR
ncbi:CdaR family transcriptional regulator [Lederbergia wuyishanensis]|uniref:Carbohydrate diacid regulator n=1 Tax=Lederbergia wuyishanensis TaxID=1347903 RepID=A0ABU0D6M6_9BACI|nr:sugar diacid recognition domain-containing protein [Lederbergia wuyishanensis]MCJ8008525.1 helix-turn-helix domain-containing protein [Lederbergia wuyishanensis]MDQ0344061.1 carbohydrate diacid regulator [Lederbergia wuyishanensis]